MCFCFVFVFLDCFLWSAKQAVNKRSAYYYHIKLVQLVPMHTSSGSRLLWSAPPSRSLAARPKRLPAAAGNRVDDSLWHWTERLQASCRLHIENDELRDAEILCRAQNCRVGLIKVYGLNPSLQLQTTLSGRQERSIRSRVAMFFRRHGWTTSVLLTCKSSAYIWTA